MAWSVDSAFRNPENLICVYTGWCELFLCLGSCEWQVVRLFLWGSKMNSVLYFCRCNMWVNGLSCP